MFITTTIALAIGSPIAFKSLNNRVLILGTLLAFLDLRISKTYIYIALRKTSKVKENVNKLRVN